MVGEQTPGMKVEPGDSKAGTNFIDLSAPRWALADLIDFELFVEEDSKADPTELERRDAGIREKVVDLLPESEKRRFESNSPENRRWWLHHWVIARREGQCSETESAGLVVEDGLAWMARALGIFGVVLGFFSLLGLLAASKVIDVPLVLMVYLAPQVLLLVFALTTFVRQRFGWSSRTPSVFLAVFSRMLSRPFGFLGARAGGTLQNHEQLARYDAGMRLILGRGKLRREALGWPLLCLLQKAAAYFSAAVVFGMVVVCIFAHFNFGWGSTWNKVDAGVVHWIVGIFAKPWAWLFPEGIGYPTLDEIRLSQTFRNHSLPESFPVLSSWWIFLCLSLFTYACVPRFLLLAYSRWRSRRALDGETFQDHRSDRLFRRLAEPQLTRTVSQDDPDEIGGEGKPTRTSVPDQEMLPGGAVPPSYCEIYTELELNPQEQEEVRVKIEQRLRLGVHSINSIYSQKDQKEGLRRLAALKWEDGIPRVLFLYRACDPISANVRYLANEFLQRIGTQGCLVFGLVGKSSLFSNPAEPEDVQIWSQYADRLKTINPNVEIEILTDLKS